MPLLRIVDVSSQSDGCHVRCYVQDRAYEVLWQGKPPTCGDIWEGDPENMSVEPKHISSPAESWSVQGDAMRWRKPVGTGTQTRMQILRDRHTIRKAVRASLDASGFIEIDAPLLVRGTTPDVAVESFDVGECYLATSTEYQMKRLAVGGMEKIYSLTQNFRAGDTGTFRNPEFTMLEWGRVGGTMTEIENDTEAFTLAAMKALGLGETLVYGNRTLDMRGPWKRETVAQAVERLTGVCIADYAPASILAAAQKAGLDLRPDWMDDTNFVFSLLMDKLQPAIGTDGPVFLTSWPAFQTTSAKGKDDNVFLVDRSELYISGIEIADGFAGLADVAIQEYLFAQAAAYRKKLGMKTVTLDQAYLAAMKQGAPYGAGMALGFDRLVMLLLNQPTIATTLAFAWEEL